MPAHPTLPMLIERLERISADSPWAHRASGLRRALLQYLERSAAGSEVTLEQLMAEGWRVLERAVKRELP